MRPPTPSATPEPTKRREPDADRGALVARAERRGHAGPDGAIEIARDVLIVGSVAAYSPDGTQSHSPRDRPTARPARRYVWHVGDREANAVTTDHGSQLAGWLGGRLLVSRVVDGTPRTSVLDLSDNSQRFVHDGAMWRPTVGPGRKTAAWWGRVPHQD